VYLTLSSAILIGTCPGPNPIGYISEGWEIIDTSQKRGLEVGEGQSPSPLLLCGPTLWPHDLREIRGLREGVYFELLETLTGLSDSQAYDGGRVSLGVGACKAALCQGPVVPVDHRTTLVRQLLVLGGELQHSFNHFFEVQNSGGVFQVCEEGSLLPPHHYVHIHY